MSWELSGFIVTVFALAFTIFQIMRTKNSADAAKEAVTETSKIFQANVILTDISKQIKSIELIREYVKNEKWDNVSI